MKTIIWFFIVYSMTLGPQTPIGKSKAYHFGTQVQCEKALKQFTDTRKQLQKTIQFWNKKCKPVVVELDLGKI